MDYSEGLFTDENGYHTLEALFDTLFGSDDNSHDDGEDDLSIITLTDENGEDTKFEFIHIPVLITESGLKDVVYNDFYIGKNANVVIIAGCGIHNDHHADSQHDGIHSFYLEEGAHVKYIEKEQKELREVVNETRKIANSVEIMAKEMVHMNEKIDKIDSKVEMHHTTEPNKLLNSVKTTVITAIASAIVGAIIMLILK